MIETEKKQERILLIGVELQGMDNFDMSMEELASLAKTAGGDVRGSYTQKREKYDTKTFVGSGKLEEIAQMVEADEITTVVVNNRLTPRLLGSIITLLNGVPEAMSEADSALHDYAMREFKEGRS